MPLVLEAPQAAGANLTVWPLVDPSPGPKPAYDLLVDAADRVVVNTRTVNVTLLLGEGKHVIPVSFIEAGRWDRHRAFRPGRFWVDSELRRKNPKNLVQNKQKFGNT